MRRWPRLSLTKKQVWKGKIPDGEVIDWKEENITCGGLKKILAFDFVI